MTLNTPWKYDNGYIRDANGLTVLDVGDANMDDDTARHIVHCLNMHEALVAALEAMLATVLPVDTYRRGTQTYNAIMQAQEVIAKAKGATT